MFYPVDAGLDPDKGGNVRGETSRYVVAIGSAALLVAGIAGCSQPAPGGDSAKGTSAEAAAPAPGSGAQRPDARVDPAVQRARDADARRILTTELRREEERLEQLKREFNNGEPERRGDERNFALYQQRVAEMRALIGRKESDIAAIRRELGKLPQ
jgi:hypothetical protein